MNRTEVIDGIIKETAEARGISYLEAFSAIQRERPEVFSAPAAEGLSFSEEGHVLNKQAWSRLFQRYQAEGMGVDEAIAEIARTRPGLSKIFFPNK